MMSTPQNLQNLPHYTGHRKRLKERFRKSNGTDFGDYELLELFLCYGIQRADVKPLAKELLHIFGSISGVFTAPRERLMKIKGAGENVIDLLHVGHALFLRTQQTNLVGKTILACEDDVVIYLRQKIGHAPVENFMAIFLDTKNAIITDELLQQGTVNEAPLYPREVLKRALELGASSIILAHNHPSGDPTPSTHDIIATKEVMEGGKTLGLTVHDHLIIGRTDHVSLRNLGLM